jgi:hypothetical protein
MWLVTGCTGRAGELMSGPKLATRARLLYFNRTQTRVINTLCSPVMLVQTYQTTWRHKTEHTVTGVKQLFHTEHNTLPSYSLKPHVMHDHKTQKFCINVSQDEHLSLSCLICWMDNHHLVLWCGPCGTQRQVKN